MRIEKKTSLGAALFLLAFVSACGNLSQQGPRTAPAGSYQLSANGGGNGAPPDGSVNHLCSNLSPNVLPAYDFRADGSERYTVCENPNSEGRNLATRLPTGILIHSHDFINYTGDESQPYSRTYCVFPSQEEIPGRPRPGRNAETGALIFQCIQSAPSGIFANFPTDISFNGVFIVPRNRLAAMRFCLDRLDHPGDVSCPEHSYGKFR